MQASGPTPTRRRRPCSRSRSDNNPMVVAEPSGSFRDRALPGIWLSANRATLQTVCGVRFSGCGYSVRYDLPTATTFPKSAARRARGRGDTAGPRGPSTLRMLPHITPFPGRRPSFLQVTSRVKGEPLRGAFSGQDVRKKRA